MTPLLEISGLTAELRSRRGPVLRPLDGVSLTVAAGQCLGLAGESGSGKTMLALAVLGLLPPGGLVTGGRVRLDGTDVTELPGAALHRVRGAQIGMVFQDPASALNPVMTIGQQVAEVARIHGGHDRHAAARRAAEVLGLVAMPDPALAARRYPHELSGGLRQRAMIAIALAGQPRLLIADEPTTALDVTTQAQILALLDDLRGRLGMAVILISHDLGLLGAHADRVAVMYAGRVAEAAPAAALLAAPRHPYTRALLDARPELGQPAAGPAGARRVLAAIPGQPPDLSAPAGGCAFAPRCARARAECAARAPELAGDPVGRQHACFFPVAAPGEPGDQGQDAAPLLPPGPAAGPAQPPLLRVAGLVKSFPAARSAVGTRRGGPVAAVAGVSFELRSGQTLGLVGESGSGKTTIARLLAGLETPDAGSITFRGTELAGLRRRQRRATPGIALMFQDAYGSLDPRMRAGEIVREPLIIAGAGRKRAHWRTVARLLGEVGLPADAADRYPGQFSGGQRQRLALARALVLAPALIIADEPVSALDVSVQAQILNLMRRLQRQYGLSYLLISHDLAVVRYMADEIAVLRRGELVEAGPAQAVCDQPAHPYTRELIDAAGVVALSAAQSHAAHPAGRDAGEDAGEGARPIAAEPA